MNSDPFAAPVLSITHSNKSKFPSLLSSFLKCYFEQREKTKNEGVGPCDSTLRRKNVNSLPIVLTSEPFQDLDAFPFHDVCQGREPKSYSSDTTTFPCVSLRMFLVADDVKHRRRDKQSPGKTRCSDVRSGHHPGGMRLTVTLGCCRVGC